MLDLSPLRRSTPYRRLWFGSTFSSIGGALTTFAVPLQIYDTTHSSLAVGGLGLAQLLPLLTVGLWGGHLADTVDRRRLLIAATTVSSLVSAGLAVQALAGSRLIWPLYALAACKSLSGAIGGPARRATIPTLLTGNQLAAGLMLNRITFQVTLIAGPALGGLIASWPSLGLPGCYLLDTASFLASFWGIHGLPSIPPSNRRPGAAGVAEGLRLIRHSPTLTGALLTDLAATTFALPVALFPAINAARFHANPQTLGLFMTAIGIGGLLTAIFSGPLSSTRAQGRLMLCAVAAWGAAFGGFALATSLWATLSLLAAAGAADTLTVVLRGLILQTNTPDHARGRISAAESVITGGGNYLGDLGSGALATITNPTTSALAGVITTIAATLAIAATVPHFTRYQATTTTPPDPPAT